jgi:predicted porin
MKRICSIICLVVALLVCSDSHLQAAELDPQVLRQLQETIRQQQQLLQQQAIQIQHQEAQLKALQQQVTGLLQKADAQPQPPSQSVKPAPGLLPPAPAIIASGNDKIRLTLSGQVNRAINVVGDGAGTTLYHVDNNVSNSRFRLVGSAAITSDLTLGTRLELAFTADESSKVSQTDQTPGTYLNARWADISLASKKYGKLSLGKGNTASYLTAASDLSKTDIILYSSVADISGGLFFRKKSGQLTSAALADVFTDYDGLNVKSRLRYDSPTWHGFHLAGSIVSGQRSDLGLHWAGEGYGFQSAAGFGIANPKQADSGLQYDGSFSLLHTASGLNLTLSSGMLDKKAGKDAFSYYVKLGWLADLTNQGSTAFGIDLSRSENSVASGDRGTSVGAAVVQEFKQFATELYLQYRIYSLAMGDGTPVYDINVGTLGVRVKF